MNTLILSDEELQALYNYAVAEKGDPNIPFTGPAASAWCKIGELTAKIPKSKEEKKDA